MNTWGPGPLVDTYETQIAADTAMGSQAWTQTRGNLCIGQVLDAECQQAASASFCSAVLKHCCRSLQMQLADMPHRDPEQQCRQLNRCMGLPGWHLQATTLALHGPWSR